MAQYQVLNVLNNKFPCNGPRTVPIILDFTTAPSFNVDLKLLQQQGLLEDAQTLFIDNADNTSALTLTMSGSQQRIIIPPQCQAYLPALLKEAQFTAASAGLFTVRIQALNFPTAAFVWSATSGTVAANVAVTNFPTNQLVTLSTGTSYAFNPLTGGINLTTAVTSASTPIVTSANQNMRLVNTGTFPVSVRWGTGAQTAVATDLTLMPNQSILVNSNAANTLAAISPGGASSLNIIIGTGGLTA